MDAAGEPDDDAYRLCFMLRTCITLNFVVVALRLAFLFRVGGEEYRWFVIS